MPLWLVIFIVWLLIRDESDMPKPVTTIHATWGDVPAPVSPGNFSTGGTVNGGQDGQVPVSASGTVGTDTSIGAPDGLVRY